MEQTPNHETGEPSLADFTPCVDCGARLMAGYCARCGERRPDADRLRMSKLVRTSLDEITDFEHSKLIRTLRTMLVRPGVMTRDYLEGRRKRYLGPVKLFITAFALSLFAYSFNSSTAVFDVKTFNQNDTTGMWRQLVTGVAAKRNIPLETFEHEVSLRWQRYLSYSQVLFPLALAVALKLLYLRRRRFYGEHLIFALHYLAFIYASATLFWPLYALSGIRLSPAYYAVSVLCAAWWLSYLVVALRSVYGGRLFPAMLRSLAAFAGYFLCSSLVTVATLICAILFPR